MNSPRSKEWRRMMYTEGAAARHNERRQIVDMLGRISANDRVLDVGCGEGILIDAIKKTAHTKAHIMGCEKDPLYQDAGKNIYHADILQPQLFPARSLTHIIFSHVLEHIDRRQALENARFWLEERGGIYIAFFLHTRESIQHKVIRELYETKPSIVSRNDIETEVRAAGFHITTSRILDRLLSQSQSRPSVVSSLLISAEKRALSL